ncbi:hypothetical protein FKP32DRAFT_1680279, partial [Trametes sanguinea]
MDSVEATSHFGAVGRLIGRSSSKRSTASLSKSSLKGEKDAEAVDKRKSRIADIPLLETHLLPSLRDTVDRMTQLPKHSDEPPVTGSSQPRPPSITSSSRAFDAPADPPASTNIPRLRSRPSTAPKSALKSPARRAAAPAVPSSAPQTYSRSMRTPQLPPAQPEGSQSESDTGYDIRDGTHRLRNPGHGVSSTARGLGDVLSSLPQPRAYSKSKSNPSTPQDTRRFSVYGQPQPQQTRAPSATSSSLPRPRMTRKDYLIPTESGLELERQVGKKLSPGRLIVTNATIVPSSSESDRGAKKHARIAETSKREESPWSTPNNAAPASRSTSQAWTRRSALVASSQSRRSKPAAVGLGLNVDAGFAGGQSRFAVDDDESVYEHESDTQSLLLDEPVLIPPSDIDDESIYEAEVVEE